MTWWWRCCDIFSLEKILSATCWNVCDMCVCVCGAHTTFRVYQITGKWCDEISRCDHRITRTLELNIVCTLENNLRNVIVSGGGLPNTHSIKMIQTFRLFLLNLVFIGARKYHNLLLLFFCFRLDREIVSDMTLFCTILKLSVTQTKTDVFLFVCRQWSIMY